jgi:hypothetical protein
MNIVTGMRPQGRSATPLAGLLPAVLLLAATVAQQATAQTTDARAQQAAITLDAVNLTDELQQSYYAFEDAGGPDTHNFGSTIISRSFALGLRYSF